MANFLSLPPELREQIYNEYLKSTPAHEISRLDILLASRRIYLELGTRLYESTWFRVTRSEFPGLASMDEGLRKSIKHIIFDVMSFCASKPDGAADMLKSMHSSGALPSDYKLIFQLGEYIDNYGINDKVSDPFQYAIRQIIDSNETARRIQNVLLVAPGVDFDSEPRESKETALVLADCCFALMHCSLLTDALFTNLKHLNFGTAQVGQRTEFTIQLSGQESAELSRTVKILPVLIVNPENAYQDYNTDGSEIYAPASTRLIPGSVPESLSNVQLAPVLASLQSSPQFPLLTYHKDLLERLANIGTSREA